jgi:hypothetical protein
MKSLGNRVKDPNEVLDYLVKWQPKIGTDTIASSTWTVVSGAGLVLNDQSFDNTAKTTTVWAAGGTDGIIYTLLNHLVTNGGRTIDEYFYLTVESKT